GCDLGGELLRGHSPRVDGEAQLAGLRGAEVRPAEKDIARPRPAHEFHGAAVSPRVEGEAVARHGNPALPRILEDPQVAGQDQLTPGPDRGPVDVRDHRHWRLQHSLQHALDGPIEAVLVHPAPEVGAGTEYGPGPREKDRPRARVHQLTHAVRNGEAFCRAQGIALVGPVESNHPDLAFAVRTLLFGKTNADQGLAGAGIYVLHALNLTAHAHRPGGFGRARENYRFCSEVPS